MFQDEIKDTVLRAYGAIEIGGGPSGGRKARAICRPAAQVPPCSILMRGNSSSPSRCRTGSRNRSISEIVKARHSTTSWEETV